MGSLKHYFLDGPDGQKFDAGTRATALDYADVFKSLHPNMSLDVVARVCRWRGHVLDMIESWSCSCDEKELAVWAAIEKIEGCPLSGVIVDCLCRERGVFANPDVGAAMNRAVDDEVEKPEFPAKTRNHHERDVALMAAYRFRVLRECWMIGNVAAFVSAYYRNGDGGLAKAESRALEFAAEYAARQSVNDVGE